MATGFMSALGSVYRALVARLTRKGVNVGGTAGYPRVEVHSIIENEPMDKGWNLRTISCIVECISKERMSDVMQMNEDNLSLILEQELNISEPWAIIGIQPGQSQEITEVSETNAVLYRLLQNVIVYVERITE